MITPCKDCTERIVNCHSTCSKYLDWKLELSKYKEKVTTAHIREAELTRRRNDAIVRMQKCKHHS